MKSIKLGLLIGATIFSINTMTGAKQNIDQVYKNLDRDTGKVVHWLVNPENMMGYMGELDSSINMLANGETPTLSKVSITSFQ